MNMERVSTEIVGDAHAYTRSDVPWALETRRHGRGRLIDFISGGGMRTFGRTVRQEEARRRQIRALVVLVSVVVAWFVLLLF